MAWPQGYIAQGVVRSMDATRVAVLCWRVFCFAPRLVDRRTMRACVVFCLGVGVFAGNELVALPPASFDIIRSVTNICIMIVLREFSSSC